MGYGATDNYRVRKKTVPGASMALLTHTIRGTPVDTSPLDNCRKIRVRASDEAFIIVEPGRYADEFVVKPGEVFEIDVNAMSPCDFRLYAAGRDPASGSVSLEIIEEA